MPRKNARPQARQALALKRHKIETVNLIMEYQDATKQEALDLYARLYEGKRQ